jgi:hypothetical protein
MATQPQQAPSGSPPLSRQALLEQLRELCNGPSERRAFERWPVDLCLEAWLQLDGKCEPPIPVELLDLSSGGAQVALAGHHRVWPGQGGLLISQTHGEGCGSGFGGDCGSRRVQCRWQRPHPQQPLRQCLGLAFTAPG